MKNIFFWSVVISLVILPGCSPGPDGPTTETVVITEYDTSADFSLYETFAISDTIGLITDASVEVPTYTTDAQSIVSRIVSNMNHRGYQRVNKGDSPDLAINVLAIKELHYTTVVYPGYWVGYPGYGWGYPDYWGYYGYGYYYPWYYNTTVVYYYETSSLIIELVDLRNPNSNNKKLTALWMVYIRGVLDSSPHYNLQNMLKSIDEAFIQSPYLTTL